VGESVSTKAKAIAKIKTESGVNYCPTQAQPKLFHNVSVKSCHIKKCDYNILMQEMCLLIHPMKLKAFI
jgi:hypothetical protein